MLNMRQKQAVTKTVRLRYKKLNKPEKSVALTEFVNTTGYNRSYARRLLGMKPKRAYHSKKEVVKIPKSRVYDKEVFKPLRKIWILADNICGKRLKPFLPDYLENLERHGELKLRKDIKQKLVQISSSTIDRMLAGERKRYNLKGKASTKPGTLLKNSIQIRTFADWDDDRPGFLETDLVAFCGGTLQGDYVNGLNMTDVATGWVGLEAVVNKAQVRVHAGIDNIRNRLPFDMLGLDSDNGVEFINYELKRYCEDNKITFTRTRPYKKNDNCFVEQKNFTVLRRFLGYARYDTDEQLKIIKEMLTLVELYVNFFQPVMKLKSKERHGSKVYKTYDVAKTPYQRLRGYGTLSEDKVRQLEELYLSLSVADLKRKISKLQDRLGKTLRYTLADATNT